MDFRKFVDQVFGVEAGEKVLIIVDEPTADHPSNPDWDARHIMAENWRARFETIAGDIGFQIMPVMKFSAINHDNGQFPEHGKVNGQQVVMRDYMDQANLVIALTEISVTAELMQIARYRPGARTFRAASAPLARADMEDTCYDIDYEHLKQNCGIIAGHIEKSEAAEVIFSTGHKCYFDLRHRSPGNDNGYLKRDKIGPPMINLPSGEVFIVPYEGEIEGDPSLTKGDIPIKGPDGSIAILHIEQNKVQDISGDAPAKAYFQEMLDVDPTRRNIGELAFGCNESARLSGLFIEDEKAGLHLGLGRSDFLGGTIGPENFVSADTVLHMDTPYAKGCAVSAVEAYLIDKNGNRVKVIEGGDYILW